MNSVDIGIDFGITNSDIVINSKNNFSYKSLRSENFAGFFSADLGNHFFFLVWGGLFPHSFGFILPSVCVMFTNPLLYLS